MSYEFKVGQKVVCIEKNFRPRDGETVPIYGEVYTIRELTDYNVSSVRLKEIHNSARQYFEAFAECTFVAHGFRPLVSDTQPWLKEILEQPPLEIVRFPQEISKRILEYIFGANHNGR